MQFQLFSVVFALAASLVSAHPGPHQHMTRSEITRRSQLTKRCPGQAAKFNAVRKRRALEQRSILSARSSLAPRSSNVTIFTEGPHYETIQNDTCVLTPDVTAGPYVWPRSQTLRQDMSEGEAGVPLYLDIGVLNVNTCEPLPDVLVDLWHCNSVCTLLGELRSNSSTDHTYRLEVIPPSPAVLPTLPSRSSSVS